MTAFWLVVMAGAAAAVGIPIALSRAPAQVSPKADLAYWNRINAEVISMIRVRDHIFLRVALARFVAHEIEAWEEGTVGWASRADNVPSGPSEALPVSNVRNGVAASAASTRRRR